MKNRLINSEVAREIGYGVAITVIVFLMLTMTIGSEPAFNIAIR